jgi:hypothetical protein
MIGRFLRLGLRGRCRVGGHPDMIQCHEPLALSATNEIVREIATIELGSMKEGKADISN